MDVAGTLPNVFANLAVGESAYVPVELPTGVLPSNEKENENSGCPSTCSEFQNSSNILDIEIRGLLSSDSPCVTSLNNSRMFKGVWSEPLAASAIFVETEKAPSVNSVRKISVEKVDPGREKDSSADPATGISVGQDSADVTMSECGGESRSERNGIPNDTATVGVSNGTCPKVSAPLILSTAAKPKTVELLGICSHIVAFSSTSLPI